MATPTGPGNGTSSRPQTRTERRAAERARVGTSNPRIKRFVGIGVIVLVALALVVWAAVSAFNVTYEWLAQFGNTPATSASSPSGGKTTPASNPAKPDAPTTWKMHKGNYKGNRWFAAGVKLIKTAKSAGDARKAAEYWLEGVKEDPVLLASASHLMLHRKVKASELVDKNGWATKKALETYLGLKDLLDRSKIVVDEAPRSGYNTGIYQGKLVRAGDAVINGDRKAIRITTPDGEAFWILGRCGNLATLGAPKIPKGPTDNEFCDPPRQGQGLPEFPEVPGSIGQKVGGHRQAGTKTGATRGEAEKVTESQQKHTDTDQPVEGGADADDKAVIVGNGDNENGAGDQVSDGVVTDDD